MGDDNLIVVLICVSLLVIDGALLHLLVGRLYVFFGKMDIKFLCPFFTLIDRWDLFSFDIVLYEFFICFGC